VRAQLLSSGSWQTWRTARAGVEAQPRESTDWSVRLEEALAHQMDPVKADSATTTGVEPAAGTKLVPVGRGVLPALMLAASSGSPLQRQDRSRRARRLGVSHGAVRQTMLAAGVPTDQQSRNARIRAMAAEGLSWPTIAAAVGLSPSAVRYVCRDLPGRPHRD
jgi:hypothetical protein